MEHILEYKFFPGDSRFSNYRNKKDSTEPFFLGKKKKEHRRRRNNKDQREIEVTQRNRILEPLGLTDDMLKEYLGDYSVNYSTSTAYVSNGEYNSITIGGGFEIYKFTDGLILLKIRDLNNPRKIKFRTMEALLTYIKDTIDGRNTERLNKDRHFDEEIDESMGHIIFNIYK